MLREFSQAIEGLEPSRERQHPIEKVYFPQTNRGERCQQTSIKKHPTHLQTQGHLILQDQLPLGRIDAGYGLKGSKAVETQELLASPIRVAHTIPSHSTRIAHTPGA